MSNEPEKTELLIEQVKNHPMLFDKGHENFKDIGTKAKLWDHIASNMDDGSDGTAMKNKWKNLRDAYIKYLRSHKPNHGLPPRLLKQYRTWPWASHMAFLRPYITWIPRKRIRRDPLKGSSAQEDSQEEDDEVIRARAQTKTRLLRKRLSDQTASTATPKLPNTSETSVDKVIAYLNKRQREYDDVDLIFMGYAKTVKKMSKNRQATIKFHIAKIIMESELEESEDVGAMMDVKTFHNQEENNFYFQNV